MHCFSCSRNPVVLILTIVFVFAAHTAAAQRVSCETTLYSHAKMLLATKAMHHALLRSVFTVTYVTSEPVLLQPFGLQELADAERSSLRLVFTEQKEGYVLGFNQTKTKIRFQLPPVVAWENFDLPRAEIERVFEEHPDASVDLDYAHAYGTILDPVHRFRPYLQVHGLVKSNLDFGRRVSLGFYASCGSALAERYRNSEIDVYTPFGWRCFIPVLEGQASLP